MSVFRYFQMSTYLIIGILIVILISIVFYLLLVKANRGNQGVFLMNKQKKSTFTSLINRSEASEGLQKKLIDMVGGNREEAEKLVAKERFGLHGKSETYYWWKAIQKLEHNRQKNK